MNIPLLGQKKRDFNSVQILSEAELTGFTQVLQEVIAQGTPFEIPAVNLPLGDMARVGRTLLKYRELLIAFATLSEEGLAMGPPGLLQLKSLAEQTNAVLTAPSIQPNPSRITL